MRTEKGNTLNLTELRKNTHPFKNEDVIKTEIDVLDSLLGGGVELGSTIQIVSESGTGKSTISLLISKEFCNKGKNVLYIDTEYSISEEMLRDIGLNIYRDENSYRFYYLRLSTFADVEKKLDEFISTNEISLIVIDSLAGLINAGFTNLNKGISINEATSSYNSRPLGMFMNKYKTLVGQRKIALLFTNQYRNKIDIKGGSGTQLKEYGGKNIRYNSDSIIKIGKPKEKDFTVISQAYSKIFSKGLDQSLELIKSNKKSPREHPFYLVYGRGISDVCTEIYVLKKMGIIKQSGTYYSIQLENSEIKENGLENFIKAVISKEIKLGDFYVKELETYYLN